MQFQEASLYPFLINAKNLSTDPTNLGKRSPDVPQLKINEQICTCM